MPIIISLSSDDLQSVARRVTTDDQALPQLAKQQRIGSVDVIAQELGQRKRVKLVRDRSTRRVDQTLKGDEENERTDEGSLAVSCRKV